MEKLFGLRTVAYRVPDLAKARDWYSKTFATEPYFDEPFYVGFNIGGYELGLQPYEDGEYIPGNTIVAYWAVDNVEKKLEEFISAGATVHEEKMDVGGGLIVASVKDLWGNIIGIIYNPYFELPD